MKASPNQRARKRGNWNGTEEPQDRVVGPRMTDKTKSLLIIAAFIIGSIALGYACQPPTGVPAYDTDCVGMYDRDGTPAC